MLLIMRLYWLNSNGYDSDAWVQFFRDRFTLLGYTISQVPISPVVVGYIDPMYQVIMLEPVSYAGYADMMEFYELIRQQTRASISSSVPEEVAGDVDDVSGVLEGNDMPFSVPVVSVPVVLRRRVRTPAEVAAFPHLPLTIKNSSLMYQ